MDIAFHIPTWVFWLIGVPVVAVVLFFAWFGWVCLRDFGKGGYV